MLTVTDANNHKTTYTYDTLNRVSTIVDPANGTSTVTWTVMDLPYQVTPPNGLYDYYGYNGFGQPVWRNDDVNSSQTSWTYDPDGNVSQQTDSAGHTQNWTYDALDRPLTTAYPNDTAENVAFSYDQAGHGFGVGRLTGVTDAAGSLSRSYDERGNLTAEARVNGAGVAAATLKTAYAYDAASRVSGITYPSGLIVTYGRNASGEATGVAMKRNASAAGMTLANGASYFGLGERLQGFTYGTYDVSHWLTIDLDRQTTYENYTSYGTGVFRMGYSYDPVGNVTGMNDGLVGANSQGFTYDALDRLSSTTATAAGATNPSPAYGYTYDALGNRLTETPGSLAASTWSYWNGNQDYVKTATPSGGAAQAISSDGIGDITGVSSTASTASFTYNQANRMATSAVTSMAPQVYAYDWQNRLLTRTVTSTTPAMPYQYQYDQDGALLEEQAGGLPQQDYVWLNGEPVATVTPSSGAVTYLLTDRLKQPRVGVQPTGSATSGHVVWSDAVSPFGVVSSITSPVALQMNLRLPGQVADPNGGWVHNGARDYLPAWGRYLEIDPLRLGGGSYSLFGYAHQNPLRWTDPSGLLGINDQMPSSMPMSTPCPLTENQCSDNSQIWQRGNPFDEMHFHDSMHVYKEQTPDGEWGSECTYQDGKLVTGTPSSGTADLYRDWDPRHLTLDPGGPRMPNWIYNKY